MSVLTGRRCFKLSYPSLYKTWHSLYVYKRVLCASFTYFNINETGYKSRNNYIFVLAIHTWLACLFVETTGKTRWCVNEHSIVTQKASLWVIFIRIPWTCFNMFALFMTQCLVIKRKFHVNVFTLCVFPMVVKWYVVANCCLCDIWIENIL